MDDLVKIEPSEIVKPGKAIGLLSELRDQQTTLDEKGGKVARHAMLLAYQIALVARYNEDLWHEICGSDRWEGFRRRPKMADQPDALKFVVRLSVGFHGIPADQTSSTRTRAMRPAYERHETVQELKRLLDTQGGAERLIAWETKCKPKVPEADTKNLAVLLKMNGKLPRRILQDTESRYMLNITIGSRRGQIIEARLDMAKPLFIVPVKPEKPL